MDGEYNGKPYFFKDDLGGKTLFLVQHPHIHISQKDAFIAIKKKKGLLSSIIHPKTRQDA